MDMQFKILMMPILDIVSHAMNIARRAFHQIIILLVQAAMKV